MAEFTDLHNELGADSLKSVFCYYISHKLFVSKQLTNLKQKRHWIIVNSYWHHTNDLLTESSKTNYERLAGQLTIWLATNGCLTVTIDRPKRTNDITSPHFIANNITA